MQRSKVSFCDFLKGFRIFEIEPAAEVLDEDSSGVKGAVALKLEGVNFVGSVDRIQTGNGHHFAGVGMEPVARFQIPCSCPAVSVGPNPVLAGDENFTGRRTIGDGSNREMIEFIRFDFVSMTNSGGNVGFNV